MERVRVVETPQLSISERQAIRELMDEAFAGDFSDADWRHALGGWHAIIAGPDWILAHAAVVERRILVDGRAYRTGYVEAVAVKPSHQGTGLGTAVMASVGDLVRALFEFGALGTGEWHFYERLGWERWRGPTFVRLTDGRLRRSKDEDDGVMILRTAASVSVDTSVSITCDERIGDSW